MANERPDTSTSQPSSRGQPQRAPGGAPRAPFDPWRNAPIALMRRLLDDMQRVGEEYDPLRFAPPAERDVEPNRPPWAPKVDVFERDGVLVLRADLPGVRKEDIRVDVTSEAVTLQGERRREREVEGAGVHCAERTCGSFYRSIPLPEGVNVERAEARVDNGVLEVTIPLDERRMPSRRVEVQGAGPQSNVQ